MTDTDDQTSSPDTSDASDSSRSQAAADGDSTPPPSSPSAASLFEEDEPQPIPAEDLPKLRAYAKDVLIRAGDPNTSADAMKRIETRWADDIRKLSQRGRQAAASIAMSVRAVMRNDTSLESALEFHAEGLNTTVEELGGNG